LRKDIAQQYVVAKINKTIIRHILFYHFWLYRLNFKLLKSLIRNIKEYKRFVGSFTSHRFSQMYRSLSANRENTQRNAGLSPIPSSEGKGRVRRDTPIRRIRALYYPLSLVV
jgi:hypothetical protein